MSTDANLSISELEKLDKCEKTIERYKDAFVEVGNALAKIRDGRLYRDTHSSFDVYCRERWGWMRDYADKLIAASGVVERVHTIVGNSPKTESQARELNKLPPEEQADAWREAVETAPGGKVTAKHVQNVVASRTEKTIVDGDTGEIIDNPIIETHSMKPLSGPKVGEGEEEDHRAAARKNLANNYIIVSLARDPVEAAVQLQERFNRKFLSALVSELQTALGKEMAL